MRYIRPMRFDLLFKEKSNVFKYILFHFILNLYYKYHHYINNLTLFMNYNMLFYSLY